MDGPVDSSPLVVDPPQDTNAPDRTGPRCDAPSTSGRPFATDQDWSTKTHLHVWLKLRIPADSLKDIHVYVASTTAGSLSFYDWARASLLQDGLWHEAIITMAGATFLWGVNQIGVQPVRKPWSTGSPGLDASADAEASLGLDASGDAGSNDSNPGVMESTTSGSSRRRARWTARWQSTAAWESSEWSNGARDAHVAGLRAGHSGVHRTPIASAL